MEIKQNKLNEMDMKRHQGKQNEKEPKNWKLKDGKNSFFLYLLIAQLLESALSH